jgi:hypothetical protein
VIERFRGGIVSASTDGGATWTQAAVFGSRPVVVGDCLDTLGAGQDSVLDYSRSLTVDLSAVQQAALVSATDAELAVGANLAAVGGPGDWELIQFKTATPVAGQLYRYQLTGRLRGLYGSAWKIAGHTAGEKFVLLKELRGLQKIAVAPGLVGVPVGYRVGVTYNTLVSNAVNLACAGVAWKPYAPTQILGARNAGRDLAIVWKRNDRLAFTVKDLPDFVQAPMSEAAESYEVEIRNAGDTAALRTLVSASPAATYTAANQTTDFGSIQNSIKVRVYQLGALGRGYMGAATL